MAIKPIVGILRRNLIMDLSIAMGLGVSMGSYWWYGIHLPRTNARDTYYKKLEDERAAARQT